MLKNKTKSNISKIIASFLIFLLLNSCVSYKKQIFFQGLRDTTYKASTEQPEHIFQRGDQLSIMVYAIDEESTQYFNQPMGGRTGGSNQLMQSSQNGQGGGYLGYLVDEQGNIEFPKFGSINILGYTQHQLRDTLQNRLKFFLKDPIVNVRLMNFRVTFISSERSSTHVILNNKTTILQLLGMVGGISWMDKRDNILIIRQIDSKREILRVNLTDASIFQSPAYYLQPNDIIYVEPNKRKFLETNIQLLSYVTTIASTVSILVLFINSLNK